MTQFTLDKQYLDQAADWLLELHEFDLYQAIRDANASLLYGNYIFFIEDDDLAFQFKLCWSHALAKRTIKWVPK